MNIEKSLSVFRNANKLLGSILKKEHLINVHNKLLPNQFTKALIKN